jgi:dimethylargininase
MVQGITTANLGLPDYEKAVIQHEAYIDALNECGLAVTVLDADNRFPDSVFVEDTALLTPKCAIIMRPGAESRRGETESTVLAIREFYTVLERVNAPGTADAGDIMMVGNHYYIGLSNRTNAEGAGQIIRILENHGMTGSTIPLTEMLHLKSGMSYLENNNLLVGGELESHPSLVAFSRVPVDDTEVYAANSLWINGTVLVPAGYPKTRRAIADLGYQIIELDVSEFRKLDGGLSCLSLRF